MPTPPAPPRPATPQSPRSLAARAAACALLFAAACQDSTTAPGSPAGPASAAARSVTGPVGESPERLREDSLAADLARAMARALGQAPLRADLKRALRAARNAEHKLQLRTFLRSPDGAAVASAVGAQLARPGAALQAYVDSLPALELYVPVREHRTKWKGGNEMLVAAALHEGEAPRGFDLDGAPVTLSATTAPTQPLLVLTKVETDFTKPLAGEWRNVEDAGGAIGTLVRADELRASRAAPGRSATSAAAPGGVDPMMIEPCDPNAIVCDEPPPPPPPPSYPVRGPGIWLDRVDVNNVEEPYYRGSPEVQVVLTGPGFNGFEGATLSCGGQYAKTQPQNDRDWKYFDMGSEHWSRKPELLEGLLFGQNDINQSRAIYQDNIPISIELWEDDAGGDNCGFHGKRDSDQALVNDLRNAYGVASQIVKILTPTVVIPGGPIAITTSLAMSVTKLLTSGDDLKLGRAIPVRLTDGSFSQQEFRLIRQKSFFGIPQGLQDNGSIRLTIIQPTVQ